MKLSQFINKEDRNIWDHLYNVSFNGLAPSTNYVYANHEQDALDFLADYYEEKGWNGAFLDEEDIKEYEEMGGEIITVGNHCHQITPDYLFIEKCK